MSGTLIFDSDEALASTTAQNGTSAASVDTHATFAEQKATLDRYGCELKRNLRYDFMDHLPMYVG